MVANGADDHSRLFSDIENFVLDSKCNENNDHPALNTSKTSSNGGRVFTSTPGGVSPRKSVIQSACQYDVTSRVSNFQNGEQSVNGRVG